MKKKWKKLTKAKCPECNKILDGAGDTSGNRVQPDAGELVMCMYCGTVSKYQQDFSLIEIAEDDIINHGIEFYMEVQQARLKCKKLKDSLN